MKDFIIRYRIRILIFISLSLSFVMTIKLTEAKYKWELNAFQSVKAFDYYFTSNYLKNSNDNNIKTYTITGWDGNDVTLELKINNFENAILCNQTGQDINYNIDMSIKTTRESGIVDDYKVVCTDSDGNITESNLYGNCNISDKTIIGDGSAKSDIYKILISKGDATGLEEGDIVLLTLVAQNNADNQFYGKIAAKIILKVATEDNFIFMEASESSTLSTTYINLKSGEIPGFDIISRRVYLWYDDSKFRINQFNNSYNEVDASNGVSIVEHNGVRYRLLTMDIGVNNLKEFQLYKKFESGLIGTDITIDNEDGTNDYIGYNINYTDAGDKIIGYYIEPLDLDMESN